jgi:hypothetical protein
LKKNIFVDSKGFRVGGNQDLGALKWLWGVTKWAFTTKTPQLNPDAGKSVAE